MLTNLHHHNLAEINEGKTSLFKGLRVVTNDIEGFPLVHKPARTGYSAVMPSQNDEPAEILVYEVAGVFVACAFREIQTIHGSATKYLACSTQLHASAAVALIDMIATVQSLEVTL